MRKFKAIIVDDEPHAQNTLRVKVGWLGLPIEIVGLADSVTMAKYLTDQKNPDFIFLDVKMPFENGFELFKKGIPENVDIIFTTAHKEFAWKAFQVQASGYLLKPIDTEELQDLLQRLIQRKVSQKASSDEIFSFSFKKELIHIPASEIVYVKAKNGNSFLHTIEKEIRLPMLLKDLEPKMGEKFIRVHRSFLVNKLYVKRIEKTTNSEIELQNGQKIPLSRAFKKSLLEMLISES